MAKSRLSYRWTLAGALAAIALIVVGLSCAALSNPRRFPPDAVFDRQIDLLAASGFICTLVGTALLVWVVRATTSSMSLKHRQQTNAGLGLGGIMQFAGLLLPLAGTISPSIGAMLVIASLPLCAWGAAGYAEGKGYSKSLGMLGLLGIVGLVILMLLPARVHAADG